MQQLGELLIAAAAPPLLCVRPQLKLGVRRRRQTSSMPSSPQEQFDEKRRLVRLFTAQLDLLNAVRPGGGFEAINLAPYEQLLARGPGARWPAGFLAGLKEGIRDGQHMLELAYGPNRRPELMRDLRARAGDALEVIESRDAARVQVILKRGRVRGEAEYYLVRAAIDRLESEPHPDKERLDRLRAIADEASVK